MILPLGVFSQEVKIAVVNYSEIIPLMPEYSEAETKLAEFNLQYQNDLQSIQDEFNAKLDEYQKLPETSPENIKLRRQQELDQIQERGQNVYAMYQQDLEQKQADLMAPIQEKLQKAIQDVSAEQGYTYVTNTQIMLYIGPSAIDATPLVKAKLGLK